MRLLGRGFLFLIRSVHRWHRGHIAASLILLFIGALLALLKIMGVVQHEWAEVPMKWEHHLSVFSVLLFGAYPLALSAAKFVGSRWPPPVIKLLTILPAPSETKTGATLFHDVDYNAYRFRFAVESDIPSFCSFAMADPAILTTFTFLQPADWIALYLRWFSANPKNFMVLEKKLLDEVDWQIVAVSIVLRIKSQAAHDIWTGELAVIELNAKHLSVLDKNAEPLLLDLVAHKNRHALQKVPELIFALPKLHLANRSERWGKKNMKLELWIEPVHRVLPKILQRIGFEGPHGYSSSLPLYRWEVPLDKQRTTELQRETSARLIANIVECAKWTLQATDSL